MTTLAPVSVVSSPLDDEQDLSPGSVTVIRPEDYKNELKTLPELLSKAPGVVVTRSGGRGSRAVASVRGSTASQVVVYVDGVLWNLGGNWAVDLSSIPLDRVDRIEIYRGYVPAAFDLSGMGAVINVVTLKPSSKEGTVTLGVGDMGLYSGSLRYSKALGEGAVSLSLESRSEKGDFPYLNDNGSLTPADDYKTRRQNNGFWENAGEIRYAGHDWTLYAGIMNRHRELPLPAPGNDGKELFKTAAGPWQDQRRRTYSASKNFSGETLDWGWSLSRTEEDRDFQDDLDLLGGLGIKKSLYDSYRDDLSLFGSLPLGEHFLEFTLKASRENLDVKGDSVAVFGGRSNFKRESYSAVVQDSFSLGEAVLTPLVRWNDVDGKQGLSWAFGADWSLSPKWRLKGTVAMSKRAPDFYEVYGDGATILPGAGLEWEEGLHWDMGLIGQGDFFGGKGSLGATVFAMDMDELIEYVQVNERVGAYKNVGKALVKGLELEGSLRWDKTALDLSWTLMDTENRTIGYRYGKALPNRPKTALDLRLTQGFSDNFSAFLEFQNRGETFLDMAEQIGLSELNQWNLGLRWEVGPRGTLSFGVNDIFDRGSEVRQFASGGAGGYRLPWQPLDGRTWYLSYQCRF